MLRTSEDIARDLKSRSRSIWQSILKRELNEGVIDQVEYDQLINKPLKEGKYKFEPKVVEWGAAQKSEALNTLGECFKSEINWQEKTIELFNVNADNKEVFDWIQEYKYPSKGILLLGPPGVGKTHLMCILVKRLKVDFLCDVLFYRAHDLLRQITASPFLESEMLIDRVAGANALVLDDIGASRFSDLDDSTLQRIFEIRGDFKRPTFLTSNLLFDSLKHCSSQRLISRLLGSVDLVKLEDRDWRTHGS